MTLSRGPVLPQISVAYLLPAGLDAVNRLLTSMMAAPANSEDTTDTATRSGNRPGARLASTTLPQLALACPGFCAKSGLAHAGADLYRQDCTGARLWCSFAGRFRLRLSQSHRYYWKHCRGDHHWRAPMARTSAGPGLFDSTFGQGPGQ